MRCFVKDSIEHLLFKIQISKQEEIDAALTNKTITSAQFVRSIIKFLWGISYNGPLVRPKKNSKRKAVDEQPITSENFEAKKLEHRQKKQMKMSQFFQPESKKKQ